MSSSPIPPPTGGARVPGAPANTQGFGCILGCVGVIALVLIAAFIGSLTGGGDGDEPYDPDNSFEARSQCRDLVESELRAPATAEFGELSAMKNGGVWTVMGYVDAENAFGAMLRNDFQCSVRVVDGTIERRLDFLG